MRTGVLLNLLLAIGSAAATEIPLRPGQAPPKQATASVHARMADIETRLGCGATKTETIYVYRRGLTPRESVSLAPSILVSGSGRMLVATPRHPLGHGVDSVRVFCGSRKATVTLKASTGADDFLTDPVFRSVVLDAREHEQVRVRLYGDSTSATFSISTHEREAWREVAYYITNFSQRTGSLPEAREWRTDILPSPPVETKPRAVDIPEANYPERIKAAGIEGRVIVDALVDTAGSVRTALVLKSLGSEMLDLAAVRAALQATFVPGQMRGRPVPVWAAIPYSFRLF